MSFQSMKVCVVLCVSLLISGRVMAVTDIYLGLTDGGATLPGPQLLHYRYNPLSFTYTLDGNLPLEDGTLINSLAVSSTQGSSGGIYAAYRGTANQLSEISWNGSSFGVLRSIEGAHSDVVVDQLERVFAVETSTSGRLYNYVPSGSTFGVNGFVGATDPGGTAQLAVLNNNDIVVSGETAGGSPTGSQQYSFASSAFTLAGQNTNGALIPYGLSTSPTDGQLWYANKNIPLGSGLNSLYELRVPLADEPFFGFENIGQTIPFTTIDHLSDGTLIATGESDFFTGTAEQYLLAIDATATARALQQISISGPEPTVFTIDQDDTIHVSTNGQLTAWVVRPNPDLPQFKEFEAIAQIHGPGDTGAGTAIVSGPGAPDLVFDIPVGATRTQEEEGYPTIGTANSVTKTGLGTLVMDAANGYSGPTTVLAGTLEVANADAVAATSVTVGTGATLAVDSGVTLKAPAVIVNGGTLSSSSLAVNGGSGIGSLAINAGTLSGSPAVTIASGGQMSLLQDARVSVGVGGLSVDHAAGGGLIDLGSGQVVVAAGGISAADLRADILAGRNDGGWDGNAGITSATVASSGDTRAVGYVVAGDGSARVSFAAPGDTDLSGQVNIIDLVGIDAARKFGSGLPADWSQGDFNYDGVTNVLDLIAIDTAGVYGEGNYFPPATSAGELGVVAAVPEPGSLGLFAGFVAGIALTGRSLVGRRRAPLPRETLNGFIECERIARRNRAAPHYGIRDAGQTNR
jgi:autotransporter-associated beta strand protein